MPMASTLQNNFTNGESFLSRSVKFTIWPLEKSKREVPTCATARDAIINYFVGNGLKTLRIENKSKFYFQPQLAKLISGN
jgi:hypothetical protein